MESWLLATNKGIIAAMAVACLLPYGWAYLAKWLGGFRAADNQQPRVFLAKLSQSSSPRQQAAARANAAQQNSFESLPLFLLAVVVALLFFVPTLVIARLAWLYVVLRVMYGVAYVVNWSILRSGVFLLSLACPLLLLYLACQLS